MTKSTHTVLREILVELRVENRESRLWTRTDIAYYCSLKPATVSRSILCKPGFPKPIRMESTGNRRVLALERE